MLKTIRARTLTAAIAVLACAGLVSTASPALADTPAQTKCRIVTLPLKIGGQSGSADGTLCTPSGASTVQLLIHGWTYNQNYFDWPYADEATSYANAANSAGYATLAIDRIAAGGSMVPLSVFDTMPANIQAVHGWVEALRAGAYGTKFAKVVGVGHSQGSVTLAGEAGNFPNDFDAIVTTGFAHAINYAQVAAKVALYDYPAMDDAKFASSVSDAGYLTSVPGSRTNFYAPGTYDPASLALDEQLKSMGSVVDLATTANYPLQNVNANDHLPVLDVLGQNDVIFCGFSAQDCSSSASLQASESQFYGSGSSVEGLVVPNTGHDLNLSLSAPSTNAAMIDFVNRHVGPGTGVTGSTPGIRPAVPTPPAGTPSLAARVVQATFVSVVMPTVNQLNAVIDAAPGMSDQQTIVKTTRLLVTIGNLTNAVLGTVPQSLLGPL